MKNQKKERKPFFPTLWVNGGNQTIVLEEKRQELICISWREGKRCGDDEREKREGGRREEGRILVGFVSRGVGRIQEERSKEKKRTFCLFSELFSEKNKKNKKKKKCPFLGCFLIHFPEEKKKIVLSVFYFLLFFLSFFSLVPFMGSWAKRLR